MLYNQNWQSDVLLEAWSDCPLEERTLHEKTIGKRMREIRTSGLKGDLRNRSPSATAPEVYQ